MKKIGLIPAAGYARRLGNIDGSKEMLQVRSKFGFEPVCHSLIRQFETAGIKEIVIITRPDKYDLIDHINNKLNFNVKIKKVLINKTESTLESICAAYQYIKGKIVYLGFPDMLLSPQNAMKLLSDTISQTKADLVLGAFLTEDPGKVDMIDFDSNGKLTKLVIKDSQVNYKYAWVISCWKSTFTNYIYHEFQSKLKHPQNDEIYIGHIMQSFIKDKGEIFVQCIDDGSFIDIGV